MSDSDSESEVFWGPITMKEIKATLGIATKDKPRQKVDKCAISIDSIEDADEIDEKNDSVIVIDDDSIEEISDSNNSLSANCHESFKCSSNVNVDPLTLSEDENSSLAILKINASNNSFQETLNSFNYSKQFNKIDIDSCTPNDSIYSNNDNDFDPLSISEHKNKSSVKASNNESCSKDISKSLKCFDFPDFERMHISGHLNKTNDNSSNSYIDLDPNDSEFLNTSKNSSDISVNKNDNSCLYIDLDSNKSDLSNTSETVSNRSIDTSIDQSTNFNTSSKSFKKSNVTDFEHLKTSETDYNRTIDTSINKNEIDQPTNFNTSSKSLKKSNVTDFEHLNTIETDYNRTIDTSINKNIIDQSTNFNTSSKSFKKSNITDFEHLNTSETGCNRTIDTSIDKKGIDQLTDFNTSSKSFKKSIVTDFQHLNTSETDYNRTVDTSIDKKEIDQVTNINTFSHVTDFGHLNTSQTANNRTIEASIEKLTNINITLQSNESFGYLNTGEIANNKTIDTSINKNEIDQRNNTFKSSDVNKSFDNKNNEYSTDKMYTLQSMETSASFNNVDKITPHHSNANESINNDRSTNTSNIESLYNTSYSDNSNFSGLNDTLEEVERLLQCGLKYNALKNESQFTDTKKENEIKPTKIPLIKIQKENTPLKIDNQFKVPISNKNKNKLTTPRNKISKFNDIISPVGLYIKNSSTPVIRNVQIKNKKSPITYLDNTKDESLIIPSSPVFPQECPLPKRVYQCASKVITKSEISKMALPNSIKKYMPKTSPVVIKQERIRSPNVRKQILKSTENSVCEISLDSTADFTDVSFRTVKPAVRKH